MDYNNCYFRYKLAFFRNIKINFLNNKMVGQISIKEISKDIIEILGITYYSESYLTEMLKREHSKGFRKSVSVHSIEGMDIDDLAIKMK